MCKRVASTRGCAAALEGAGAAAGAAGRAGISAPPLAPFACSAGAGAAAPAMKSTMEASASEPACRDVAGRWAAAVLVPPALSVGDAGLAAGSVDATLPKSFSMSLPVAVRGISLVFCAGCDGSAAAVAVLLRSASEGSGLGQGIVPRGFAAGAAAGSGIWDLAPVVVPPKVFRGMAGIGFAARSIPSVAVAGFGVMGMGSPTHSPGPDRLGLT